MRHRVVCLLAVGAVLLTRPGHALAGMPSIRLSDWAEVRLSTISFFGLVFLLATAVVRWLWNNLARDFPKMPRLTYRRALAAVTLWAMLLAVVLTMIAGSRELLTPGAWQKRGPLYEVAEPKPATSDAAPSDPLQARKDHLKQLYEAMAKQAAANGGRFPESEAVAALTPDAWEVPGGHGLRYVFLPDAGSEKPKRVLAYEPEFDGGQRFALLADGQVVTVTSNELRRRLAEEQKP